LNDIYFFPILHKKLIAQDILKVKVEMEYLRISSL